MGHGDAKTVRQGVARGFDAPALLELAGLTFATRLFRPGSRLARQWPSRRDNGARRESSHGQAQQGHEREANVSLAATGEVVEKAKHHILGSLAAMISGSEIRPGTGSKSNCTRLWWQRGCDGSRFELVCGPSGGACEWSAWPHADETMIRTARLARTPESRWIRRRWLPRASLEFRETPFCAL